MDRRADEKDINYESPIFIDSLTHLYNRYFLYNIFPKLKEAARSSGTELTVFMLDIDNFKYINDSYGHLRGDSVINEVGRLLKECVRGHDLVIRYAGDEYVVLCRGAGHELTRLIGNRIIEKINKNVFKGKPQEPEVRLTISGGFAVYPKDAEEVEELIDYADKALYFSKERGKNRISASNEVTLGSITYKETIKKLSSPRFINRFSEINRLKEIWKEALSPRFVFILIKGKIGLGKSRLLDEFQRQVSSQGAEILKVICSQRYSLQPYQVLSEAIEEFIKKTSLGLSFDSFLSQEELGALAELIPALKNFAEARGLPKEKIKSEPMRLGINLFNGFRYILRELSWQKGLFLYFDDIQWLDKATFELLKYFLTIESIRQIMIAATFCEDEATGEQLPYRSFFSESSDKLISLDLLPFSLEQTQEFIASIFPNINALTEFSLSVYNIASGNCLFTQEILKCLVEDGKILYKDNQWQLLEPEHLDIPLSLEEVIQRRLKRIDPDTKEMLTQAAVMGRDIQLETLRQIVAKDQGHLFDLIDRAREKGMFSPEKKIDKINFTSDSTQKAIYSEIEANQKINLHLKIERIIKELYKNDLEHVIGDLVYHAQEAGNESGAAEYRNRFLGDSLDLFNHEALTAYLKELSKEITLKETIPSEIGIEKIETEISEEILIKVIDLIRFLLVALKNISLYPPMSKIREESIKRVYEQVGQMLKGVLSLTLSELERILLVNGKRLPHGHEKDQAVEAFITLMVERDIKAIQFLPQIENREINTLLTTFAWEPDDLRKKGGLGQVLTQEKISHIRVDTVDYGRLTADKIRPSLKEKGRPSNVMLLDFLSGKLTEQKKVDTSVLVNQLKNAPEVLAMDLTEVAKDIAQQSGLRTTDIYPQTKIIAQGLEKLGKEGLPEGWQAYRDNLVKLLLSLDKSLLSGLISLTTRPQEAGIDIIREAINSFSDSEVVDAISSGYTKGKESLLEMKDLFNKLILQPQRQEKINPVLEKKLKSMGMDETEISFVTQKEYKSLTLKERTDTLLKLSAELYHSIGRENIKGLIAELISLGNKDSLKEIITHIWPDLENASGRAKEIIYQILGDFITLISASSYEFDTIISDIFSTLGKRVEKEENVFYPFLLRDIEMAINWIVSSVSSLGIERWIMRNRFNLLSNLISCLYKRLEAKEESDALKRQKELIQDLVFRLLKSGLIEALTQQLKDPSLEYNVAIEDLILKFGASSLDGLIAMVTRNVDFSFEDYLYRRKIYNILLKMGAPLIDKIKNSLLIEKDPVKLKLLVEIIGYGKEAELVEAVQALTTHTNTEVRKEVVIALSNIADSRSLLLLSEMCSDSEPQVAHLAKTKLKILKAASSVDTSKHKTRGIKQWLKKRNQD